MACNPDPSGLFAAMKLAQFKTKDSNKPRLGVLLGDVISRGPAAIEDLNALVSFQSGPQRAAVTAHDQNAIEFLPAVYPSKILAIGRNYADHAIEGGGEPPKAPLIFA